MEKDEDEKVRQELDIELDSIRNLLIIPHCEPFQESGFQKVFYEMQLHINWYIFSKQ